MIAVYLISFVLLLLLFAAVYERTTPLYKVARQLQGPGRKFPLIGNISQLLSYTQTSGFVYFRKYGNLFRSGYFYYYFGKMYYQVHTAEHFEKILGLTKTKKGIAYYFLQPFIGEGILTSFGQKWFERRRLITPSFHFKILNNFFSTFSSHTDALVNQLKTKQNENVNVKKMFSNYSLHLICETSMGVRANVDDIAAYEQHLHDFGFFAQTRVFTPYIHNDFLYRLLGYARQCDRITKPLLNFTIDLIKRRRAVFDNQATMKQAGNDSESDHNNIYFKTQTSLMDTLLTAQTKDGSITDAGIEEEVNTFVFTGHDTITAGMTYVMLCIAEHPEVQQKLFEEITSIVTDQPLAISQIADFKYLDLVIKEAMRMFPPVPLISRTLVEELVLDGVVFPPGVDVHLLIYDLHRDPKWFPEPEKFIPERFLPENTANRHHFAYVPFSAGVRNCIGQKYAMLEMKTMVINVLRSYRMEAVTKIKDLVFIMDMILHTNHPIEIKFTSREGTS